MGWFSKNNSEPEKSTADMSEEEFRQWVADKKGVGNRHKELTTEGLSPTEVDLKIQNEETAKALRLQANIEANKRKAEQDYQDKMLDGGIWD